MAADSSGYYHLMRYAVENQIAHRFAVEGINEFKPNEASHRKSVYGVQWRDAHDYSQSICDSLGWPYRAQDEEHLANWLQRFANTGEEDTGYGCLRAIWSDRLSEVAGEFVSVARPWLILCEVNT